MKDQHTKIKGYRDLSQTEIDLMNRIKEQGEQTRALIDDLCALRGEQMERRELSREHMLEAPRAIEKARTNLQTGYMWLVRSVALPESF
jgi:molybdate-binding protein